MRFLKDMNLKDMKVTGWMMTCVLAASMAASAPVHARGGKHAGMDEHGMGRMLSPKIINKLGLSEEQKDKLAAIKKKAKEEMRAMRAEVRELRKQLKGRIASEAAVGELRGQFEKLQAKEAELRKSAFEKMLKVREILTSEQRKKLQELLESKMKRWRERGSEADEE